MTEDISAPPGWAEDRLDHAFIDLPDTAEIAAARRAYADCLAARKSPAAPSDLLGTEFERCDGILRRELQSAGIDAAACDRVLHRLEAIEAEIASDS